MKLPPGLDMWKLESAGSFGRFDAIAGSLASTMQKLVLSGAISKSPASLWNPGTGQTWGS